MVSAGRDARREDLARFETEGQAINSLDHPNIVRIYEYGRHADQPYIAMEYVEGGTLFERLEPPPPPIEAARLIETMARAVHVAHRCGVIHRDLKPGNILLAPSRLPEGFDLGGPAEAYDPKIADFGLAKLLGGADLGLTRSGVTMGTVGYMPPEQALGQKKKIGPASDVYALGAILYHLLTGRPPFVAQSQVLAVQQAMNEDPLPPSLVSLEVPAELDMICLKCLQREPQNRYASALDLAEDLRRYRHNEPLTSQPPARKSPPSPSRVRRWPLILGLASVGVLLVLGAVVAVLLATR
jgi:serine/threonine protein kinase